MIEKKDLTHDVVIGISAEKIFLKLTLANVRPENFFDPFLMSEQKSPPARQHFWGKIGPPKEKFAQDP